jgi:hypothetical protein
MAHLDYWPHATIPGGECTLRGAVMQALMNDEDPVTLITGLRDIDEEEPHALTEVDVTVIRNEEAVCRK